MLKNVLNATIRNCPNLQHICLQTGLKHYVVHEPPFHEYLPRPAWAPKFLLHTRWYFVSRGGKEKGIDMVGIIFGFSPDRLTNLVGTLCCVYAAICKHEGVSREQRGLGRVLNVLGCRFGCGASYLGCCGSPCKEYAFKWKHFWKVLADRFDVELANAPIWTKLKDAVLTWKPLFFDHGECWSSMNKLPYQNYYTPPFPFIYI